MKRSAFLCAALLCIGAAKAEDGLSLGIGTDFSTGDYGSDITTDIWSVPLTAKFNSGNWTWKASLPWLRIDGDVGVLPGLGNVGNSNPSGRGRGNGNGNGGGNAPPVTETAPETGSASGLGDVRLAATYAFDTGSPLGIDVTGNVKLGTADEDKGLGTGENDYGLAVDLYGDVAGTTLFGGAGYTMLGDSEFIQLDDVLNAYLGASWQVGAGTLGAMYDWRQAASDTAGDRSELTGFYAIKAGAADKVQLYATKGLADGSPDWGVGASYSHQF